MAEFSARYWLKFDKETAHQPVICQMARQFADITFNIRQATVNADSGIIAIELSGPDESVHGAVRWLESRRVLVEPVELQTIEG